MRVLRCGFVLFLAVSCASVPRAPLHDPLASAGPYAVAQYDVTWRDEARQRVIKARIYAPVGAPGPSPIVIFAHGLGNSREGYPFLGRHWASYGFVSIHPQFPGADTEVTRHGVWRYYRAGFNHHNWRNIPEDIHYVIDTIEKDDQLPVALRGRLDRARIGVSGHSIGAYAALAIGGMTAIEPSGNQLNYRDPRVRAAIPISMSESFPPVAYSTVAIPMLHITGTRDSSYLYGTAPSKRRVPFDNIHGTEQYLVTIRGANHSTFSDEESRQNATMHDVMRISTILFWKAYLQDDAGARETLRSGAFASEVRGDAWVEIK